jgi:molybdopterin-guanine dinucleotide biosynthesis protein A
VSGLGGVVLCGGRSSRMGRPKAWLDFGGEPLLVRVVARVAAAAQPVVVVAAPDQVVPALPAPIEIARDPVEGQGPLAGIAAGLGALEGRASHAFVSATDAPFLVPALIRRLHALCGEADACVVRDGDHHHALAAIYAVRVRAVVDDLLAHDQRRTSSIFEHVRTVVVGRDDLLADEALRAADPHLWSFRNLNSPEDYAAAVRDSGLGD